MNRNHGRSGKPHWDSLLDLSIAALQCANDGGGTAQEVVVRAETYLKFLASRVMQLDEQSLPSPDAQRGSRSVARC